MAKMKKRPAKKKPVKAKTKKLPKKAMKQTAKKQTVKAAPKKKASAVPAQAKPTTVKKAVPDEETRKAPASKGMPAVPKEPDLDLRQLKYFVKIVEQRSMSRASVELHVAQSALSAQIATLETGKTLAYCWIRRRRCSAMTSGAQGLIST